MVSVRFKTKTPHINLKFSQHPWSVVVANEFCMWEGLSDSCAYVIEF